MIKRRVLLLGLIAVTVGATGCLNTRSKRFDQRDRIGVRGDIDPSRPALDEKRLGEFGMELYWDSYIENEILTTVTMQGRHIYVWTASNRLYQIDVENGRVNWMFDVGLPLDHADSENPIATWVYTPAKRKDLGRYDEVFLVARDNLIAIDLVNGSELWRKRLPFATSSPPVASLTHVYVGAWNNRLYAVNKDSQEIEWDFVTDGDITARPAGGEDSVYVPSHDQNVYRVDGVKPEKIWPFATRRAVTADPYLNERANLLYIGSADYSLYVVNTLDGRLEWKHETGGEILRQPAAVSKYVYAVSRVQTFSNNEIKFTPTVYAYERKGRVFSKTQHEVLWNRPGANQFLAMGLDDVYVREREGESNKLVRLDIKKGFFRDAFVLGSGDFFCTNTFSPRIQGDKFIASVVVVGHRNGWIFALKEDIQR